VKRLLSLIAAVERVYRTLHVRLCFVEAKAGIRAPYGYTWVCVNCGKHNKDRYGDWDTSCMTWAALCREDTLVYGDDGRVRAGRSYR
jgi:hypothetical protein